MEDNKTPNEQKGAFACIDPDYAQFGLTKLEYFTGVALQAIIQNPFTVTGQPDPSLEDIVNASVSAAKLTLEQFSNETNG